jgi:hypothetical protein
MRAATRPFGVSSTAAPVRTYDSVARYLRSQRRRRICRPIPPRTRTPPHSMGAPGIPPCAQPGLQVCRPTSMSCVDSICRSIQRSSGPGRDAPPDAEIIGVVTCEDVDLGTGASLQGRIPPTTVPDPSDYPLWMTRRCWTDLTVRAAQCCDRTAYGHSPTSKGV